MATTSTTMPDQQQQPLGDQTLANPEAVPSSSWHSSSAGSIGPFFAVISVLTILAVLSCIFGRMYSRRQATLVTPLESIKGESLGCSCIGWAKRKLMTCRQCTGDVGVAANNDVKVRDVDVPQLPQP